MKIAMWRFRLGVVAVAMGLLAGGSAQAQEALEQGFRRPPDSAKPHTWWHWMNGNITKEGLTKDIREMRRVGLGGAQIFNVDDGIPAGPVAYLSPEWLALFKHAVEEADKAGLELCFHNCAGWSSSGGPWVTPEQAMQKLVWSEARVRGPSQLTQAPTPPAAVRDYYRDIALLAFPTPPAERVRLTDLSPKLTASAERFDGAKLIDGNPATCITLPPPAAGATTWVQIDVARPLSVRTAILTSGPGRSGARGELQVSDDGATFKTVDRFAFPNRDRGTATATISCSPVTARCFRFVFTSAGASSRSIVLGEIELLGVGRIEDWPAKAGFERIDGLVPPRTAAADPESAIVPERIVDLTARLGADGALAWEVPEGEWTILRLGHTCTGAMNAPAVESGRGLEVDKLSRESVEEFWKQGVAPILEALGPLAGKTLNNILIDSYEVGFQTWTRTLPAEFQRRRGYDLVRYLPACTGRVVGSVGLSERFLWDFRLTLADLFHDAYYGRFAELAHERGLQLSVEPYGNGNFSNLTAGGRADIPMTEFWSGSQGDAGGAKMASSVAHTYGRRYVGAEAFTASAENGAWRNDPWSIKALGDRMWAYGVNRLIFHRYAHQPWTDLRPGMTMSRWGMHFEWPITWWEQAPAWTGYLARGQFMLQSGAFVGDLLYFVGESAPNTLRSRDSLEPRPPVGYDYDGCDPEVLRQRLTVKEGRLVLPEGASYALLVLPPTDAMTPGMAGRIRDLVRAGAVVYGPKPGRSPSLNGYPECDAATAAIGTEVWGDCDGKQVKEHVFGQGKVFWGAALTEVLPSLGVAPDAEFRTADGQPAAVDWMHRREAGADWYFLASGTPHYQEVIGSFRVQGRQPELWHPDTGLTEVAPVWETAAGVTRVTLRLDPCGSVFVVFRAAAPAWPTVAKVVWVGPLAVVAVRPAAELVIDKAVYGVLSEADDRVDLTEKVRALVKEGKRTIPGNNAFAGRDPVPNVIKELRLDYTLNGEKKSQTVSENQSLTVPEGASVDRVLYGYTEERPVSGVVEVTAALRAALKAGKLEITASNSLAGDPAQMVAKQLRVDYRLNGVPGSLTVAENQTVRLPPAPADIGTPLPWDLAVGAAGTPVLTAWLPGAYALTLSDGTVRTVQVASLPSAPEIPGPWTVRFPVGWGAPESADFAKLQSWSEHAEAGVRYFSGTAEYVKEFEVDGQWLGPGKVLALDLGQVLNFAEVSVNGQAFGVLWKPPFRLDVSGAVKPGRNQLTVRVTNLWPNRLIGDEQIDDGRKWGSDGRLLEWPAWIQEGKPKPPDGRFTWTTWRHYRADSPLQLSGLLGPVTLRPGVSVPVR
jgi:hypothetical protein